MELRIHLKICEACGCLWYRSQVETSVYCTSCNQRFKEFPTPQSRKRRGRPKKTTLPTVFAVQDSAQIRRERDCFVDSAAICGFARVRHDAAKFDRPRTSRGMSFALLAPQEAVLSTQAALRGGAR